MLKRFCSVVAVVLLAASPAGALTISGVTITLGGSNTADDIVSADQGNTSAISTISSGGTVADAPLATMSASTRYASNLWADTFSGDLTATTTNSYDLSLSVSADPGTVYNITIDSLFQGLLQTVDECFFCFDEASVDISAVTVTLNSVVEVPLATSAHLIALTYYDETFAFSDGGQTTLTDQTGTTNLVFNVEWTSTAFSTADEAGVLLGLEEAGGPVGGVTASEYASLAPSRDLNLDGHFITVTATVTEVPEPTTALLLATGLAIASVGRRRR